MTTDEGCDVIGDVHGHATKLVELLAGMDYEDVDGAWRHPIRQAIFVGDLIDRGPDQVECCRIARAMVEAGSATVVAGNHEFNAVAFRTPDPDAPGTFLRPHSDKNLDQHEEFLEQVGHGSDLHDEIIGWFMTLPLWVDLGDLRVVHACWDPRSMDDLAGLASDTGSLTPDLVVAASREGTAEYHAIETLLKGPEVALDVPYLDKDDNERGHARFQWWRDDADHLDVGVLIPGDAKTVDGARYPMPPHVRIVPPVAPYLDEVPVIYGHYWNSGEREPTGTHTACVDYSVGKGGPLVAYRWSGESVLRADHFAATP